MPLGWVKPNPRNARTHSGSQIAAIAQSIRTLGFAAPLLVDENGLLLAGHGRLMAARSLALETVPVVVLSGLTEPKKRALLLADNKLAERAGWDREALSVELPDLQACLEEAGLDISVTGFEAFEIDQLLDDFGEETGPNPDDDLASVLTDGPFVTGVGDLWQLGNHRLLCGSALDAAALAMLMDGRQADVAFLDPPYNLRVREIGGRGRTRHAEFAMASGEMTSAQFESFLSDALGQAARHSRDGAVHFVCMDWRHAGELIAAGRGAYDEMLNLIVWVKSNAGQGTFYRSQHELIGVFRVGRAPHQNNVRLGRSGRNRSNVWRYAGVNSFGAGRMDDLSAHPTVKPTVLIADALKDCSRPGDLVLDTFSGSGSTILAAEKVGRRAVAIEIEPRYVDVAIRRWQRATGKDAVQAGTGRTFDSLAADAGAVPVAASLRPRRAAARRSGRAR